MKHDIWIYLTSPILIIIMMWSLYKLIILLKDENMSAEEIEEFIINSNTSLTWNSSSVDGINICSFLFWFLIFCSANL